MSKELQAVGKFVIIKVYKKPSAIVTIDIETHETKKAWLEQSLTVYSFGDEVKKVKIGDKVITHPLTPGIKIKKEKIFKDKKILEDKNIEFYVIKEEHITAIIKN